MYDEECEVNVDLTQVAADLEPNRHVLACAAAATCEPLLNIREFAKLQPGYENATTPRLRALLGKLKRMKDADSWLIRQGGGNGARYLINMPALRRANPPELSLSVGRLDAAMLARATRANANALTALAETLEELSPQ